MNILHISSAKTWRGGERQVLYLIQGLQESNHSNFLMSPNGSALNLKSGLNSNLVLGFKKGVFGLIQNILSVKKFCESNKIDIIHGHDSHAHTLLWMAYRFGGLTTKSIVTRRLINPVKNRSINKYNYEKVEKIICISEAVKSILIPSIKNPSRLIVIHSSISDTSIIGIKKSKTGEKDFVVGYVAAFTEEKDHKTFIKTAKHLLQLNPKKSYKFILVGDGLLFDEIKKESVAISNCIHFTGFVDNVDHVYGQMDLLLHTSKSEALGTSILDAMKFGLPVIATNIGGIPEIVSHGANGYLVKVGDFEKMAEHINTLATNDILHDEFSKNSGKNLSKFDVAIMVKKTIDLYQEMVN